ncbi:MAG: hypothetical protein CTY29_06690 [Methylobacter sp.]|nr:MAG: hypothetical protein CTY29_06690 [Methylobacter sp.]
MICTFLIDLKPEDLQDPLGQFNHTTADKSSVWELARTINDCLGDKSLDERILNQVFDTYWPQFETKFKAALKDNPPEEVVPPRTEQDILSEILSNTRSLSHRIRELESEAHFKSRNVKEMDFDRKPTMEIIKMLESGKYSESEIAKMLADYDMPESYARELVENTLMNRKLIMRKNNANK